MNISRSMLLGTASLALCTAAASLVEMGTAMATTATQTVSVWAPMPNGPLPGSTPTSTSQIPWSFSSSDLVNISLPEFNTANGSLESISITLYEQAITYGSLKNNDASVSHVVGGGVSEKIATGIFPSGTGPEFFGTTGSLVAADATVYSLAPGNTIAANALISLGTVGTPLAVTTSSTAGVTSAFYTQFEGTGSVVLPVYSNAVTALNQTGGNLSFSQVTTERIEATITYTYSEATAMPEPGSMMLLGSGLIGLGAMRQRGWRIAGALDWLRQRRGRGRD